MTSCDLLVVRVKDGVRVRRLGHERVPRLESLVRVVQDDVRVGRGGGDERVGVLVVRLDLGQDRARVGSGLVHCLDGGHRVAVGARAELCREGLDHCTRACEVARGGRPQDLRTRAALARVLRGSRWALVLAKLHQPSGRGTYILTVLGAGRAVQVDLWSAVDQHRHTMEQESRSVAP